MSYWKNKKVVVTGAGGFIGSHLVEKLIELKANVHALVHYNSLNSWGNLELVDPEVLNKVKVYSGDIMDYPYVKNLVNKADVVFHLGALISIPYSYKASSMFIDTNIKGTYNILSASLESKVKRVIHTSTSEVYGTGKYIPIDEKHPLQGQSPYSASKIGADKIAESFYNSFGLKVSIIRPFNTFGPRQSARAIIPTIISQVVNSNVINIGDITPIRDFTYVKDTVKGFLLIAEKESSIGETINIGSGHGITIKKLIDEIRIISNKNIIIKKDKQRMRPEKSEVFRLICDNSKAKKILGWKPDYKIKNGLKETYDYITNNINNYKPGIYNI